MCFHGEIRKIFTCYPILPGAMLGHLLLANSTGQISGLLNMSHIVTKNPHSLNSTLDIW